MKRKRRIEITVETTRVLAISQSRGRTDWCPACAAEVKLVTVDEGAVLAGVSARTLYRWVEAAKLHYAETPEGLLLVCLASLFTEAAST